MFLSLKICINISFLKIVEYNYISPNTAGCKATAFYLVAMQSALHPCTKRKEPIILKTTLKEFFKNK